MNHPTQPVMRYVLAGLLFVSALPRAAFSLTNGQAAVGVLGPSDLVTRPAPQVTINKLNGPSGVAVDPLTNKVFVLDRSNHRVLRWSTANALINGSDAEAVLGEPNFTTGTSGTSSTKFNSPNAVHVDAAGRLWVADGANNRVLRFDNASTLASGAGASAVLGQSSFTSNVAATTASGMRLPAGLFTDSQGRLWVSDAGNSRILRFDNVASKPNGASADGVLGQSNFTTGTAGTSSVKMNGPNHVYADAGGRVWVSDKDNNRVLRFDNAAASPNGDAADGVLGQTDFVTGIANLTQSRFSGPRVVAGDGTGRIYVVDGGNSRVMLFDNAASLANGAPANYVLGQSTFTTNAAPNPPNAASQATPNAAVVNDVPGHLWVVDSANNRVLRYDVSSLVPVELSRFTVE